MNKIYLYQRKEESKTQTERNFSQNPTINNSTAEKNKYKKKIAIILTISFIIIAILIFVILFVFKPWEKKNEIIKDTIENETLNYENYKKELLFTTKVNDLRRILINQTSYEIMTIDGIESIIKLYRKTYYDIYILSEKNVEEKNNNYFNKIYTASISMVSQCLRKEDEKCDLKEFVDLSISTKSNLRNLKELNDLKDIPVPLCLVNFTDTNIIISISCPESLPENIKNEIFLDLNYFRPMIKASQDKIDEMNLIVSNSKKYLRRKSKGLCDIENEIYSFCDSDINITKSSEGYLVSLQENSFINITNDIKNSFIKSKKTSLVDETSNTLSLNKGKYKSILNDFLLKLNPYIKSEENISIENLIKQYNSKLIINKIGYSRSLTQNDDISNKYYTGKETLFYKEIVGAKIYLNLKIDSGINVETSKALLNLNYDNKENQLVNILQFSNLNKILKKLKTLEILEIILLINYIKI